MRTTPKGCMERVARIELANKPWQGFRLPLHHTRINLLIKTFGGNGEIRTHTLLRMKEVHNHYATLP